MSYAQRGLIYLIKKSSKTKEYCEILLQFKTAIFYCNIFLNIYSYDGKVDFSVTINLGHSSEKKYYIYNW